MAITKVWIDEGCTVCGLCEEVAPEVFEVHDEAIVVEGSDYEANDAEIREAAESCPVEVIHFEEEKF